MTAEPKCSQCGSALPAGAPEGLCPACLLKRGFETQTAGGGLGADFIPPSPDDLARYFPQLEILQLLGRGGMGVVYKARQRELDRLVALKVLPAGTDRDPAFAERFAREARALARLSHPNIVAVYDYGQTGGLAYFVMEYIDGLNLRQVQAAAKMTPAEALAIVPRICDALQTAHDQGIVHRDIKPENILIDRKGRVKIADFGIAKLMGAAEADFTLTGAGEIMGTPVYMAPEQIEHPETVDHRADIYSLGVVFYQLLTGELPIGKFAPPSRKVQIDVRLDNVVLRALEKEPELRYQQANEIKTGVETIAGDSPQASAPIAGQKLTIKNGKAVGYLALYLAILSGLIPTIFYWFKPWAAPWLTQQGQQTMIWATLWFAIAAIVAGIASRKSRNGQFAIFAGSINLSIWLLFFVAGKMSEPHAHAAAITPIPAAIVSPAENSRAVSPSSSQATAFATPMASATQAASDDALKKRAADFVSLLMAGKFTDASGWFADAMRTAMPAPVLAKEWGQLAAAGKLLGMDPSHVTTEAGYYCVYVPCRWEKSNADIKVVFDAAGKVSGLWVVPYAK